MLPPYNMMNHDRPSTSRPVSSRPNARDRRVLSRLCEWVAEASGMNPHEALSERGRLSAKARGSIYMYKCYGLALSVNIGAICWSLGLTYEALQVIIEQCDIPALRSRAFRAKMLRCEALIVENAPF